MVNDIFGSDQYDRAIETGVDNEAVYQNVDGWCEHISVEMLGVSMLGQMVGVPIGPHRISCKYASHSIESVCLRNLFHGFLLENCNGCEHHKPGKNSKYGVEFIASAEREDKEREAAKAKRQESVQLLRKQLTELGRTQEDTALDQSASIIRLTIELFSDSGKNAVQPLCEATILAPDLFEEPVLQLLETGATDEEFCGFCIQVLASLARQKHELRKRFLPFFLQSFEFQVELEVLADALDSVADQIEQVNEQLLLALVLGQNYQRPLGGFLDNSTQEYPKTLTLLNKLAERFPCDVKEVFRKSLRSENKWERANTNSVIKELSALDPDFSIELVEYVCDSIELRDDSYEGVSADGSALDCVSKLLNCHWDKTEPIVDRKLQSLSVEGRSTLLGAYERMFRDKDDWRKETTDEIDDAIVTAVVEKCDSIVGSKEAPPKYRLAGLQVLKAASRANATQVHSRFERLIGVLAMATGSNEPPAPKKIIIPGKEEIQAQEQQLIQQQQQFDWQQFKKELAEIIEEIARSNECDCCKTIINLINGARETNQQSFRFTTIRLLAKISSGSLEMASEALPTIMSGLTDFENPSIRAVSIEAAKEMFRYIGKSLPANVLDMVIVHLQDTYVIVHKQAVQALGYWNVKISLEQQLEAAKYLINLWQVYSKQPYEEFFLEEIAHALFNVSRQDFELQARTVQLLCSVAPLKERLLNQKFCELLIRRIDPDSVLAPFAAKATLDFVRTLRRDPYRNGKEARTEVLEWIAALPNVCWEDLKETLFEYGQECVVADPPDVLLFAAIFADKGEHEMESRILKIGSENAKGHSMYDQLSSIFDRLATRAETISAGKSNA